MVGSRVAGLAQLSLISVKQHHNYCTYTTHNNGCLQTFYQRSLLYIRDTRENALCYITFYSRTFHCQFSLSVLLQITRAINQTPIVFTNSNDITIISKSVISSSVSYLLQSSSSAARMKSTRSARRNSASNRTH